MVNRGWWFVAGAGAGVYAAARARRVAESLTPQGLRDRVAGLSLGAQLLAEEVRAGAAEKEAELRDRLGLVAPEPGPPALHPTHTTPLQIPEEGTT
ncbi:hypothetical protein EDD33_1428 [Nocardioides aurantiacus]|uniref:Secreted protein n=1 Tax=Nocardioides aurantiacus TaxID=86796 RepID=A0A3N2CSQ7_9ACTN|nr:hypothetical protein EDD33_1428 [Nocardioides aurantiacus]